MNFFNFTKPLSWSTSRTFPSLLDSGPSLPHASGLCVLPPHTASSCRALPLNLHFDNCSVVMFSISCIIFANPNHSNLLLPITWQSVPSLLPPRSPHFSNVLIGTHPLPISVVDIRVTALSMVSLTIGTFSYGFIQYVNKAPMWLNVV